jgi:hypothetical protein
MPIPKSFADHYFHRFTAKIKFGEKELLIGPQWFLFIAWLLL